MRMKELSLRQDPDLRKELALLARGCDFVLPSRFKKRLRAFQQGQAGGLLTWLAIMCLFVCVWGSVLGGFTANAHLTTPSTLYKQVCPSDGMD